jgi:hypothetical protein
MTNYTPLSPELQAFFQENNFPIETKGKLLSYLSALEGPKRKYALQILNYIIWVVKNSPNNFCEARQATIARDLGCCVRTVKRWVKRLRLCGFLVVVRRRFKIPPQKRRLGCAHRGWASLTNLMKVNPLLTEVKNFSLFMALYLPALFGYEALRPTISTSVTSYIEKRYLYRNYINDYMRHARRTSSHDRGRFGRTKNFLKQENNSISSRGEYHPGRSNAGWVSQHLRGILGTVSTTQSLKKEGESEKRARFLCVSCYRDFRAHPATVRCWYCKADGLRQQHSG